MTATGTPEAELIYMQWQLHQNRHLANTNTHRPSIVRHIPISETIRGEKTMYILEEIKQLSLFSSLKVLSDVPIASRQWSTAPPSLLFSFPWLFFLASSFSSPHSFSHTPQCWCRNVATTKWCIMDPMKMKSSSTSKRSQLAQSMWFLSLVLSCAPGFACLWVGEMHLTTR